MFGESVLPEANSRVPVQDRCESHIIVSYGGTDYAD